jgi:hypothetical protein
MWFEFWCIISFLIWLEFWCIMSFFAIISLKQRGLRCFASMSAPNGPIEPEPTETTKAKKAGPRSAPNGQPEPTETTKAKKAGPRSAPNGQPEPTETTKAKKKAGPRSAGKSRQPGRPHKRLQNDVLQTRSAVLSKKLQVLHAKKTLLAERLEAYTHEAQLRQQENAAE